jgi:hypothetical protein
MIDHDNYNNPENIQPSYELSPQELNTLTNDLLEERAPEASYSHRYITVEVNNNSRYANIGRHIERAVFEEVFDNDTEQMIEEYGPYEDASRFFITIDRESKRPAGALRATGNSPNGLKSIIDAEQAPFFVSEESVMQKHAIDNLDKVWDIGTAAVLPEYRGGKGLSSVQLFHVMYVSALNNGIEHLVSIIDDKLLRMLRDHFGIPFVSLAGSSPGPYLGSEKSHAVYAHIPEFKEKMNIHKETVKGPLGRNVIDYLLDDSPDDSIFLLK